MEDNIVAGLISGVIVILFAVVFSSFWRKLLVPWFEDRVYKDIRIEGKWLALYPRSIERRQELIVLRRQGHAISGKMVCTSGGDEGEEYSLSGSFRNLILSVIYESNDTPKSDRGTISLKCIQNGERLAGKIAAYWDQDDKIGSSNVLWYRSKADMEKTIERILSQEDRVKELNEERKRLAKEEEQIEDIDQGQLPHIDGEVED